MPKISTATATLLMQRGKSDNLDVAAAKVIREASYNDMLASRLSDRLGEMQVRLEAANGDQERQYGDYLAHIAKVRELLDVNGEADVYEAIRSLKNVRVLASVALAQLDVDDVMAAVQTEADFLAGLHTKNAALYRENLALQQEIEELKRETASQ